MGLSTVGESPRGARAGRSKRGAYVVVDTPAPHPTRARAILASHPEVKRLFGTNPWSAAAIVGIVAMQLTLAVYLTGARWWVTLLVSYFVGAYANHALWVLVHECTHNLVFRNKLANRVMALAANLPMVFPSTVNFSIFHIKHHKYLGDYDHDADIAPSWEAWLLRRGFVGRLAWQFAFPVLQTVRTVFVPPKGKPASWTRWLWINVAVQLVFDVAFYVIVGHGSLRYLIFSAFFSIGPHPVGARWIQEHYVFREGQETYSYYGMLNHLAFNIGYHNEHHDLPQVPWNRLPALKRLAPEMYDDLHAHHSWTRLWLRFLFDRRLEVYRIARHE